MRYQEFILKTIIVISCLLILWQVLPDLFLAPIKEREPSILPPPTRREIANAWKKTGRAPKIPMNEINKHLRVY